MAEPHTEKNRKRKFRSINKDNKRIFAKLRNPTCSVQTTAALKVDHDKKMEIQKNRSRD